MNQFSISMLTTYLPIFLVFIICTNNNYVLANGISDENSSDNNKNNLNELKYFESSMPENIELMRRGVWSRLFRPETNSLRKTDGYSQDLPTESGISLKHGRFQLLPHDKRTIPIELRKALYAHGIVGRRR